MGFWEFGGGRGWGESWDRGGQFTATWDRGGRILSQLGGFQVSRRGLKREQRGTSRVSKGRQKQGEAPCTVVHCNLCIYRLLETFE